MDQTVAVVLAAGIGAGGAVLAQIVAATFAQRSASKRFEWEREQAEKAAERQRKRLFVTDRRELFSRFLAAHDGAHTYLFGYLMNPDRTEPEDDEEVRSAVRQRLNAITEVDQQISLLAPSVYRDCLYAAKRAHRAAKAIDEGIKYGKALKAYEVAIHDCRAKMRDLLEVH